MNAIDQCDLYNNDDEDGNPAGGYVSGIGLDIDWQNGPLGRGEDRQEPNGAFVETVIAAALQRIEYYQYHKQEDGSFVPAKFACEENAAAIQHLERALEYLNDRTRKREHRGVEGTHGV